MAGAADVPGAAGAASPGEREARRQETPVPALREDLWLHPGPRQKNGAPSWTLHDPVRNRFFRIGWVEFEILSNWGPYSPARLAARVNERSHAAVEASDIEALVRFLSQNNLVLTQSPEAVRALKDARSRTRSRESAFNWLLHRYLFMRIPLVRPDRWLSAVAPRFAFIYTRRFLFFWIAVTVLGLFLVLRQWDQFTATFLYFFTLEGILWYAVALIATKIIHELGHAVTAKHFGVRVPTMGVAFLVFWPVLYTDATEAWKLPSRKARLAIGAAGMGAELILAGFATFLWAFLPDGPARSATFLVATITWVMTLAVNLNPFMRFDGYFLLSDLWEEANLQDRSFRMAKWWIRRWLLGFPHPMPEAMPPGRRRVMILYAVSVWLYRLFLFLAIAFLVYSFFIKIVGILLFVVEIWWFILRPIFREVGVWWKERKAMRLTWRSGLSWLALAAVVAALAVPWRGVVEAPALLRAAEHTRIFAPEAGRIERVFVKDGARVAAGAILFRLASPELDYELRRTALEISLIERQIRQTGTDQKLAEAANVLRQRLDEQRQKLAGLNARRARLIIRAPFAGELARLPADIARGRWVNEKVLLGVLVDRRKHVIDAYLGEADLRRLRVGARATFYPVATESRSINATVTAIDPASRPVLEQIELASVFGGPIAVRPDRAGQFIPERAIYRVRLALVSPGAGVLRLERGVVRVAAPAESLLERAFVAVSAIVIRESGF